MNEPNTRDPGHVRGLGALDFVRSPETVYVLEWSDGARRLKRVRTDGTGEQTITAKIDWAIVSPDARSIAALAHGELRVVDLETSAVRAFPIRERASLTMPAWGDASDRIAIELRNPDFPQVPGAREELRVRWLDTATGAEVAPATRAYYQLDAPSCDARAIVDEHACGAIDLVAADGTRRPLVRAVGCRADPHWGPPPPPRDVRWSSDCRAVTFVYDEQLFIVESATARVARVTGGQPLLFRAR